MKIVAGPASIDLSSKVSALLGVHAIPMEYKVFPDGEFYIRFTEDINGEDVIIIQTTGPPQDSNFIKLLLLIDAARDMGAKSVITVVPYVAYGRQDVRYRPGEAISSKTIFKIINKLNIDSFITVDLHGHKRHKSHNFENLSAMPLLANYMIKHNLNGAFSLAPDDGAIKFVEVTSKILNGDYGWLEKTRDKITGEVSFELKTLNVKNKDVIIFDDIISTGSTMIYAAKELRKQGARRVYAACVHPLLMSNAKERILQEGILEIFGTDSIQSSVSAVSLAPLISEALKKWRR